MNSYLMYRSIVNSEYQFSEKLVPWFWDKYPSRTSVKNAAELDEQLGKNMESCLDVIQRFVRCHPTIFSIKLK